MRHRAFGAVLTLIVLTVSGCGSTDAKPKNLLGEYAKSTDVKNDRIDSDGSSDDRMANIASYAGPEQLLTMLLSAYECLDDFDDSIGGYSLMKSPCDPTGTIYDAAGESTLYGRSILVKHDDASLELVTVYLAVGEDHKATLIDSTGQTYSGGLEDFRANNSLLSSDDWILAPSDLTDVEPEGKSKVVTVTGHTPSTWMWWLAGGLLLVVTAVALRFYWTRARRRTAGAEG